ncbi:cis-abienol synthase, chloroplastic-like isoform X2 [Nicotiana tomentosiformis]|uniref:cis-abienol synthase, chloroplastic-like isoform X2 n=1 Tax=Nicotiana tomentosiformis TaxID=4098 RepID=UPI00388CAEAB
MERNDLKECKTNPAYYYAEGLGKLCQWEELMTYQKKNGSLFNSPATTAAALIFHCHDDKCLGYINSILKQHKNWVPTIYPTTIRIRLQMVDTLQKLGMDRHFEAEIRNVLDETYRTKKFFQMLLMVPWRFDYYGCATSKFPLKN